MRFRIAILPAKDLGQRFGGLSQQSTHNSPAFGFLRGRQPSPIVKVVKTDDVKTKAIWSVGRANQAGPEGFQFR
jgi:hypothetical protein